MQLTFKKFVSTLQLAFLILNDYKLNTSESQHRNDKRASFKNQLIAGLHCMLKGAPRNKCNYTQIFHEKRNSKIKTTCLTHIVHQPASINIRVNLFHQCVNQYFK